MFNINNYYHLGEYDPNKKFLTTLSSYTLLYILLVLFGRMSSINYKNNYSLRKSIIDAVKGRWPIITFFLCGQLSQIISISLFFVFYR